MEFYVYGSLGFYFGMVLHGFIISSIATITIGLYIFDSHN